MVSDETWLIRGWQMSAGCVVIVHGQDPGVICSILVVTQDQDFSLGGACVESGAWSYCCSTLSQFENGHDITANFKF